MMLDWKEIGSNKEEKQSILFRKALLTTRNLPSESQRTRTHGCSSKTMQRTPALVKMNAPVTVLFKQASPFYEWKITQDRLLLFTFCDSQTDD